MSRKDKKTKGVFKKVIKGVSTNAPMTPGQEAEAKKRAKQLEADRKAIAKGVEQAKADERRRIDQQRKADKTRAEYEQFKRERGH